MDDPYTQTAKLLDAGPSPAKPAARKAPVRAVAASVPDVVSHRYEDPESREDEAYMGSAIKRVNQRIGADNERMSGEYTKRRFNDRRFGRRNGR